MTSAPPHPPTIGHHVHKAGHPDLASAWAASSRLATDCGFEPQAMQLFVMGPMNSTETLKPADIAWLQQLKQQRQGAGPRIYVHGTYLDAICGAKAHYAVKLITRELEICDQIGAVGLVIHLPKKPPKEVAAAIVRVLDASGGRKSVV